MKKKYNILERYMCFVRVVGNRVVKNGQETRKSIFAFLVK
jgi:hypothetical protein